MCVWWQDGMVLISAGWWVCGGRVCRLLLWPQAQKHTHSHVHANTISTVEALNSRVNPAQHTHMQTHS